MKKAKIVIISLFILISSILIARVFFSSSEGLNLDYSNPVFIEKVDDTHLFYNSLSANDRALYELLLNLVYNKDDPDYKNNLYINTDDYDRLGFDHLWNIYFAMVYDHPEFFYLLTEDHARINALDSQLGNKVKITFYLSPTPDGEAEKIEKFNNAVDDFLSDIDLSANKEEIELQIHDKLISEVTYDKKLYEATSSVSNTSADSGYPDGATAYGALVTHKAICGGYALAFQYLLQKAGIPCGYLTGVAYYQEDYQNYSQNKYAYYHAWNLVKINDSYYETDTTWDDYGPDDLNVSEDYYEAMLDDEEGIYGLNHQYYNLTTKEMEDNKQKETTTFNIEGYHPYNPISESSHIRGTTELNATEPTSIYLNELLPEALGDAG